MPIKILKTNLQKNSYNNIQIVLDAARERSRELNKG